MFETGLETVHITFRPSFHHTDVIFCLVFAEEFGLCRNCKWSLEHNTLW